MTRAGAPRPSLVTKPSTSTKTFLRVKRRRVINREKQTLQQPRGAAKEKEHENNGGKLRRDAVLVNKMAVMREEDDEQQPLRGAKRDGRHTRLTALGSASGMDTGSSVSPRKETSPPFASSSRGRPSRWT